MAITREHEVGAVVAPSSTVQAAVKAGFQHRLDTTCLQHSDAFLCFAVTLAVWCTVMHIHAAADLFAVAIVC